MENKQTICTAICDALRLTDAAGNNNPLTEIRYIRKENGDEFARPIFEDGTGENGYFDVHITADSGIAIFMDICNQFVRKMW